MKKGILVLFLVLGINCLVDVSALDINEIKQRQAFDDECNLILNKYKKLNEPWNKEKDLKKCAKTPNYICQCALGNFYYDEHDYSAALEMYLKASSKFGDVINARIGLMYLNGMGTIQNFDKAIYFFEKSIFEAYMPYRIKAGEAALLSHVYVKKSYFGSLNNNAPEKDSFKFNEIRFYAWGKVAQAFGYKTFKYEDGEEQELSELMLTSQEILAKNNWLNEANALAEKYIAKINTVVFR